jgi:hypothetical protein
VRTVRLEVRRKDGWENVVFEDIEQLRVTGAPGDPDTPGKLRLTLIGERSGRPNQVEPGILDIADRHYSLVNSEVPELDGQVLPVVLQEDS